MLHLSARLHNFINELGRTSPKVRARRLQSSVTGLLIRHGLQDEEDRQRLAVDMACEIIDSFDGKPPLDLPI